MSRMSCKVLKKFIIWASNVPSQIMGIVLMMKMGILRCIKEIIFIIDMKSFNYLEEGPLARFVSVLITK